MVFGISVGYNCWSKQKKPTSVFWLCDLFLEAGEQEGASELDWSEGLAIIFVKGFIADENI